MTDLTDQVKTHSSKLSLVFGVIFVFAGLGSFNDSILGAITILLTGMYLVPQVREKLLEKIEFKPPEYSTIAVAFVGLMLFGAFMPSTEAPETGNSLAPDNSLNSTQNPDSTPENSETDVIETPEFEILSSSISPSAGETPLNVTGTLEVKNTGNASGEFTAEIEEDGIFMRGKTVQISPSESQEIEVSYNVTLPGKYQATLSGFDPAKSGKIEPTKTTTITASAPEPEPINLSGNGADATESFELESGLSIFHMSHRGSGNFQIWLLNDQGEKEELLVNRIGSFEGSNAIGVLGSEYLLDIEADGPWNVDIEQPRPSTAESVPRTYSGDSRKATDFFRSEGGLTRFQMEHSGDRNFQVWLLDKNGGRIEMLANKIGEFEGSTATGLEAGIYLLDVNANEDWSINVE